MTAQQALEFNAAIAREQKLIEQKRLDRKNRLERLSEKAGTYSSGLWFEAVELELIEEDAK